MSDSYEFNPDEILSPDEEVIHEQNKTIDRLQEQLKEANEILKIAIPNPIRPGGYGPILDEYIEQTLNYFKKWSVK